VGLEAIAEWGALWSVLHAKFYSGDEIKNNNMGGACGAYKRERE